VKGAARSGISCLYGFGDFRLDTNRRRLFHDEETILLSPKALETLIVLVRNAGKVLHRDELMEALWPDAVVEDANLTVAISQLRKALGQQRDPDEFIQTIPRVGYRFVAEVRAIDLTSESEHTEALSRNGASTEIAASSFLRRDAHLQDGAIPVGPAPLGPRTRLPASSRWHKAVALSLVALVFVGLLSYFFIAGRAKLPATGAEVKSMAVLPFRTLGTKSDDEYLGLGLADALITRLGRMRELTIRPIGAVQKFADGEKDPVRLGRELGVEAVLDGIVQHDGEKLRITARLIRVADGVALWSGKFDHRFTDIFAMQDSISEQVAEASALSLSRNELALLTKRYTDNVEAYRLYLKGRYFWNKRTQAGSEQSLKYFRLAIEADPTYAPAYAGLADAYAILVWQQNLSQNEFVPKAKAAAAKALEIDETIAEAHASLGFVKFWYDWDFAGAEREYRRAIQLNPNYSTAHHWYGEFLVLTGRAEEGFRELALAQKIDPLSLIINTDIGKMFFFTGQQDRAIDQLKKVIEMDPDFPISHLFLAMAYEQKGNHQSAIAELEKHAQTAGGRTIFSAELGYVYGRSGRRDEALRIVEQLKTPAAATQLIPAYEIALVYAGLGEKKLAFEWLDRAKAEHDPFLIYVQTDPNFDSLRDDSELVTLLK
jgi:DNA-binding winged helix-turn-helix (wHTH) protein/TolB-like protein/Tfp pilus assembly protein PilF